jgi:hypothetical protein
MLRQNAAHAEDGYGSFAPFSVRLPRVCLAPQQRRESRRSGTAALGQRVTFRQTMLSRYTLLVNQIVGAPTTPAFCIALLSSSLLTKACAASTVAKSWVTVMSLGLSAAWYTA